MKKINRNTWKTEPLPIRILQFGEGNFLRAFVDWFVHEMNENHNYDSGIAVVQPIENGLADVLQEQDGLFHHVIQGVEKGKTIDKIIVNSSVQSAINPFTDSDRYYALSSSKELKLLFSNTTEAGIIFDENDGIEQKIPQTFPGKLVKFLHRRFEVLGNTPDSELAIIPCELIENNGGKLKKCINQYIAHWQLEVDFAEWISERVHFANTLVDRIVPGYPKDEIEEISQRTGYQDRLVVKSESFHLFVIEGDSFIRKHFPADQHGFNVKYVESIAPYRTQKVRILNGAHTAMVPVGLLYGTETVKQTMDDAETGRFVRGAIYDEIIKTIHIPGEDPVEFADEVISRFINPFIRHELISISLNSISKWRVRVLPSVLDYHQMTGELPKRLVFSLACLINLHLSGQIRLRDDQTVLEFFEKLRNEHPREKDAVQQVLANKDFWHTDLTTISGFEESVVQFLGQLQKTPASDVVLSL